MAGFGNNGGGFGGNEEVLDDVFDPNATQFGGDDEDFDDNGSNELRGIPNEMFNDSQSLELDEDGQPLLPVRRNQATDDDGSQNPNRNQRGPRPAIMGAGGMRANDLTTLVDNFWSNGNNEQNQRPPSQQEQFFQGLVAQLNGMNNSGNQQNERNGTEAADREWENFLKDRNLVPNMEEIQTLFNEAGNDPAKNQQAIHRLLTATARNTYRQVAQDMQPMLTQLIQQIVPMYLQNHQKQVSSEQQFNSTVQQFYNRNPYMNRSEMAPIVRQVIQQALVKSRGNASAAIRLAEGFMQKNLSSAQRPASRNNFHNNGGSTTINWSQVAAKSRG